MRRILLALLFVFTSAAGMAQYTTTYTGTIKDLTGAAVTSGQITWTLNAPSGGSIPGVGSFTASTVTCLINATGNPVATDGVSPCTIANNSSLTPTGTSYTICRQPAFVTPGSCFVTFANGGTVDISTLIPTPSTMPNYGFPAGGPTGPAGPAPTVVGGTATALPPGSTPVVTVTGSNPYAINLQVASGNDGAAGAAGPTGPTGPQGAAGVSSGGAVSSGNVGDVPYYAAVGTALASQSPFAVGAVLLPAQAGTVPAKTQTVQTSGYTAVDAHGNSITCGYGAAGTLACSTLGWVNQVATYAGVAAGSVNNYAVPSNEACDINKEVFQHENPGAGSTVLQLLDDGGPNDYRFSGLGPYEAVANNCAAASLAWLAIPSTYKYTGSSFGSVPTNWATNTTDFAAVTALTSTTNGAVAVYPYTATQQGQTTAVFYEIIDGNGGSFSIVDNHASPNTAIYVNNFTSPAIATQNGATNAVGVIYLPNTARTATAGTITITVTSATGAGNVVTIIGTALVPLPGAGNPVFATAAMRQRYDAFQYPMQQYYNDRLGTIAYAQSLGMDGVSFINTRSTQHSTASEMYDNLHPNLTGHQNVAAAYKMATGTVPAPLVADPTTLGTGIRQTATLPDFVDFGDREVYYTSAHPGGVINLPAGPYPLTPNAHAIEFHNASTAGKYLTFAAQPGAVFQAPYPGFVVAPQQTVTLKWLFTLAGNTYWFVTNSAPTDLTQNSVSTNASASYTMLCTDMVKGNTVSNAVYTVPTTCPVGKGFTVVNENASGSVTFTGPSTGNVTSLIIYPKTSCDIVSVASSTDWWVKSCSTTDPTQNVVVSQAGTSFTPTCFQQAFYETSSSAVTVTVPTTCPVGKSYKISNHNVTASISFTGPTTGDVTALVIPPKSACTIKSEASATDWWVEGCYFFGLESFAKTTQLPLSGTATALGTTAIGAGACSTAVTATVTGATSAMVAELTPTVDPSGVTGYGAGGLTLQRWITANTVNIKVCNPTAGSITPAALTVNVRVIQ